MLLFVDLLVQEQISTHAIAGTAVDGGDSVVQGWKETLMKAAIHLTFLYRM